MTPSFDLSFNPAIAFWTIVSFLVVYYVIGQKIYPVISKIMKERAEKIATDLAGADTAHKEADKMRQTVEAQLKDVKLEERRILSEAENKAKKLVDEKTQEYLAEFKKLRLNKEEDLQRIEADFYKNFEEKVGKILIGACEKIVSCDLSEDMQQKILNERIQELKKIKEF